jgi:hypothetical protein
MLPMSMTPSDKFITDVVTTDEEQKIDKDLKEPFLIIQNEMTKFQITRARVETDSNRKCSFEDLVTLFLYKN